MASQSRQPAALALRKERSVEFLAMTEPRKRLQQFIAKCTEVYESRYVTQLQQSISVSTNFNIKESVVTTSRIGPDEESVKAVILDLRFFCQDNEGLSMRNMDSFISSLPIAKKLKADFSKIRSDFNTFLDSSSRTAEFGFGSHTVTNREIFEAFMYGKYAHLTKHKTVDGWERLICYDGMRAQFDIVLHRYVQTLIWLRTVCQEIDSAMPSPSNA